MKDKVIVITGGAKGLGKSMAKLLAQKGAQVVISDFDQTTLEQTAKEIGATQVAADVTKESDMISLAEKVIAQFSKIDIWINNAGVWLPKLPIENVDLVAAKKLFDVNVFGTINGLRSALSVMKKQNGGVIVNILSTTAIEGMNGSSSSIYVASKYALKGLVAVVREEVKGTGVELLSVYPGGIKTDIFKGHEPDTISDFMNPDSVAGKIVDNLESATPEKDLILKRPGQ